MIRLRRPPQPSPPAAANPAQRFVLIVAVLVLVPLLALAALGLWYAQADRIAAAEARRQEAQAMAVAAARDLHRQADRLAGALLDAAAAAYRQGGAQGLRGHYLAQPDLALVVVFDAAGNRLFPEPQEVPLFAEAHFLRLAQPRLAKALAAAQPLGPPVWAGSPAEPGPPVAACRQRDAISLCLLLPAAVLAALAPPGRLVAPGEAAAPPPGQARALAPLTAPFAALALAQDYRPDPGGHGAPVLALLLGPTALGMGFAAWALWLTQRAQLRAGQQRLDLLARISHELRTPLANLRLYAAMLSGTDDPARRARYATVIDQEAQALATIVDNALTLALRGQTPARTPALAVPDDRLRALLARYGPALSQALHPVLDLGADAPRLFDLQALDHVALNLIDNARKHAPGSVLTICTRLTPDQLLLEIRDTGPRTAPAATGIAGFGLGLRICQTMAAQAGGRFSQQITPAGSRFTLELPALPPASDAPPPCAS